MSEGQDGRDVLGIATFLRRLFEMYPVLRLLGRFAFSLIDLIVKDGVLLLNIENIIMQLRSTMSRSPEGKVIELKQQPPTPISTPSIPVKGWKPKCKFPIFIVVMSLIQIGLFYNSNVVNFLVSSIDPNRRHELWRLFTCSLAHSCTSHLWGNVISQLIFGISLEMSHYWKSTAVVYVAGVVGGSLFISVMSPTAYALGASAGIYGLEFAHIAAIILNWTKNKKRFQLFLWLLHIADDVGSTFYGVFWLKIKSRTSHSGHFGGAVTGFLVSILVLKNPENPWKKKLQKICAVILTVSFCLIFFVNVAFPSYYLPAEWNFEYEKSYIKSIFVGLKNYPEDPDPADLKHCEALEQCKLILDKCIHNETFSTQMDSTDWHLFKQ